MDYFRFFCERAEPGLHLDDFIRQSENILTKPMPDPADSSKKAKLQPPREEVLKIRFFHKYPERDPGENDEPFSVGFSTGDATDQTSLSTMPFSSSSNSFTDFPKEKNDTGQGIGMVSQTNANTERELE